MSSATATAATAGTCQLVVFALAGEEYALPITQVQEIIRFTEPRSVASEQPWMRGVISLRGKIIPICDLAARLGLTSTHDLSAKIVVVETDHGTAGVIVDEVEEVLTVDVSQLDTVPGGGSDIIDAIARIGDRLVAQLDPDQILAGVVLAAA